jgi:hypothetical protein
MLQTDLKSGLSLIVCLMLALLQQSVLSRLAYAAISRPALAILGDTVSSKLSSRHMFPSPDYKNQTNLLFMKYPPTSVTSPIRVALALDQLDSLLLVE